MSTILRLLTGDWKVGLTMISMLSETKSGGMEAFYERKDREVCETGFGAGS